MCAMCAMVNSLLLPRVRVLQPDQMPIYEEKHRVHKFQDVVDFLEESPEFASFKLHIEDSFVTACHLITKEEVAARFLNLVWIWLFSINSKERFHPLRQGNALVSSDSKIEFLCSFNNWLVTW